MNKCSVLVHLLQSEKNGISVLCDEYWSRWTESQPYPLCGVLRVATFMNGDEELWIIIRLVITEEGMMWRKHMETTLNYLFTLYSLIHIL